MRERLVEIMGRRIGVAKAVMTTVHAYTATQAVVDGPSKTFRRGRTAAAKLVPTSTGAATATTKALPAYRGRFDGVAIRAPIPVGSIADVTFVTVRKTSVDEVKLIIAEESKTTTTRYDGVVGITDDPIVSSDIIGDSRAAVVDGDLGKVMAWYDNEWGYANQMVREVKRMFADGALRRGATDQESVETRGAFGHCARRDARARRPRLNWPGMRDASCFRSSPCHTPPNQSAGTLIAELRTRISRYGSSINLILGRPKKVSLG